MALEAVVFQQELFGYYNCKDWFSMANEELPLGNGSNDAIGNGSIWEASCSASVSPEAAAATPPQEAAGVAVSCRRKRRRSKCVKNREEVESQRMTHIAVERNRRKQMNEYLALLRSLMPPSYVQRGDQASIVGGAINYVKELEQLLQSLEVQKRLKRSQKAEDRAASPFADFFIFPQYTACSSDCGSSNGDAGGGGQSAAKADVEVTMAESHANVKVLAERRPKQLLKLMLGLQSLRLTPLHLNVTAADQMALYSFSLKVEDDCLYSSMEEIAEAVYQILGRIQEEAGCVLDSFRRRIE